MPRSYQRVTKEQLEALVPECLSYNEVCRRLGKAPVGGNSTNISKLCQQYGISTAHMTGSVHNRGKVSNKRVVAASLLVLRPIDSVRLAPSRVKRALDELERPYVCVKCGCNGSWNGEPLVLEIDHIDSCYWNNVPENLQYLCPNCHAQETKRRPQQRFAQLVELVDTHS